MLRCEVEKRKAVYRTLLICIEVCFRCTRVRDLLLIFYTVWIPCSLDFSVSGVGRGNEMVVTFMIFVCPIAQGLSFFVVAWVASALFRVRADWPKWLLHVLLFFSFFVGMLIPFHAIFFALFGVCQTACLVPVPW